MAFKTCGKCGETKEVARFTKSTGNSTGYRSPCKDCNNLYYQNRRKTKYEQVRSYEKKFHRERALRSNFNLTEADYQALLKKQEGGCAICAQQQADTTGRRLAVDHCHTTGKVRGLLCGRCNTGLGMFTDNLELLTKAFDYLEESRYK